MDSKMLLVPMKWLTISWLAELIAFCSFYVAALMQSQSGQLLCVAVLPIAGFAFYICLGILASRLGKSWIVWVGLTILTSPVGFFVAYFMMEKRVDKAISTASAQTAV